MNELENCNVDDTVVAKRFGWFLVLEVCADGMNEGLDLSGLFSLPSPFFPRCVSLDKLLNFSGPQY